MAKAKKNGRVKTPNLGLKNIIKKLPKNLGRVRKIPVPLKQINHY